MVIRISANDLKFFEIRKESHKNFAPMPWGDLSEFWAQSLKWIGDVMRQSTSQFFWSGSCYCWYTDDRQDHEQCVFMTANGNVMFQDITEGTLYRVSFKD